MTNSDFGKVPPQAVAIEESLLGALILEANSFYKINDLITPEAFYKEEHKAIFTAIENMHTHSKPLDRVTLSEQLRSEGQLDFVGGSYKISELTNGIGNAVNVEYHARIIVQKHMLRELIRISVETQEEAFNETTDVFDLQDKVVTDLLKLQNLIVNDETELIQESMQEAMIEVEAANTEGQQVGLRSCLSEVNRITGGYHNGELYILAARPSLGKSVLTRNEAVCFAKQGVPGLIFSLEMTKSEIVKCMISAEEAIYYDKLRSGGVEDWEWKKFNDAITKIEKLPIYINDRAGLTMNQIYLICKKMKLQHGIGWIIIDYINLIRGDKDLRLRMIDISNRCKEISKELNLPVIAVAQLSREVEKRNDKKPQLSDLKESGSIEQDADTVIFIHRPAFYGIKDEEGGSLEGLAKLIFAKHRQGKTGEVKVGWEGHYQRFVDFEEVKQPF